MFLASPGDQADLADHRGMLVAERAADDHLAAERTVGPGRGRSARDRRTARSRGSIDRGHAEELQQLVVPVQGLQVHQHGAAGVGDVGDVPPAVDAAGQVPQQPAVGGAEDRLAGFGGLASRRRRSSRIQASLPPAK